MYSKSHDVFVDLAKIGPTKSRSKDASPFAVAQTVIPTRSSKYDHPDGTKSKYLLDARLTVVEDVAQSLKKDRKRKRKDHDDDIEGRYIRSLALEEALEEEKLNLATEDSNSTQRKSAHLRDAASHVESLALNGLKTGKEGVESVCEKPLQHETIMLNREDTELEKSSRTVFLANVCTSTIKSRAAKKTFMDHLSSCVSSLPESSTHHAVESLRFRSTAYTDSGIPRKAAFIRKELMETTAKSTNAYAVYTTQAAAREATKRLNGTVVLGRHLRVDSVAHPSKQDHRRCVFVGNLGFVSDTTAMDDARDGTPQSKPRRGREPADVEEGLWRHFEKVGTVESVRVVRDKITRIGKGFAYVQFVDANAVEKALLLNEKKFPPMLPRILRVTRAKNVTKIKIAQRDRGRRPVKKPAAKKGPKSEVDKPSQGLDSLLGKANKLLGCAGAAQINRMPGSTERRKKSTRSSKRRAEHHKSKTRQPKSS